MSSSSIPYEHTSVSSFSHHSACSDCGSSDGLANYSDGGTHCFACGKTKRARGAGSDTGATSKPASKARGIILDGYHSALSKRGISEETCRKWNYQLASHKGQPVQVANYQDPKTGEVVAQKVRTPDKDFSWTGSPAKSGLYGMHLWPTGGKMLVVTEGEIDALTVSQLQGNKWPVVSVPNGAQSARKDLAKHIDYLESFESVILFFDNDDPGRKAAAECADLLTPGKAKIAATLPCKDPNECLQRGRGSDIIDAIWKAKQWRPDGIITAAGVIDEARKPVEVGRPWPWDRLTALTFGRRLGELYTFGGGVGSGKTDVFTQCIAHDVQAFPGEKLGVIYLEQPPVETAKRIAGKLAGKPFHIPNAGWTQSELDAALNLLLDRVLFYNHFGSCDWDTIKKLIRFMALSEGVRHLYLDHLTALTAHADDERRELDGLLCDMASLCQSLRITLHAISHLSTPEGKAHEEGGQIAAKHFRGSRSIMQWSHFMFGLERNQQATDPEERKRSSLRVVKDRYTGRATGELLGLVYDRDSGLLLEDNAACPFPPEQGSQTKQDF